MNAHRTKYLHSIHFIRLAFTCLLAYTRQRKIQSISNFVSQTSSSFPLSSKSKKRRRRRRNNRKIETNKQKKEKQNKKIICIAAYRDRHNSTFKYTGTIWNSHLNEHENEKEWKKNLAVSMFDSTVKQSTLDVDVDMNVDVNRSFRMNIVRNIEFATCRRIFWNGKNRKNANILSLFSSRSVALFLAHSFIFLFISKSIGTEKHTRQQNGTKCHDRKQFPETLNTLTFNVRNVLWLVRMEKTEDEERKAKQKKINKIIKHFSSFVRSIVQLVCVWMCNMHG